MVATHAFLATSLSCAAKQKADVARKQAWRLIVSIFIMTAGAGSLKLLIMDSGPCSAMVLNATC